MTQTFNGLLLRTEKERNSKTWYVITKDSSGNKELLFVGVEFIGFWY